MTKHWTFEDIDWSRFDPTKVNTEILRIIKAGSVVEHNGTDYGIYLRNVFKADPLFLSEIDGWVADEVKHGRVLAAWIKLADSSYDFDERFKAYVEGFPIQTNASTSIRGSCGKELLTRCMIEIGTSSVYSVLSDASEEPLLKHICLKIAADEFRHYKLFYEHFSRYQEKEKLSVIERLKVAVSRLLENEDDELAFAYYTANAEAKPYDRKKYTQMYGRSIYKLYTKVHVNRGIAMLCKAVGVSSKGLIYKGLSYAANKTLALKAQSYDRKLNKAAA